MNTSLKEAERSVLGSMLRDNAVIPDVIALLKAEDFSTDANGRVWRAILALWEQHQPADAVTVADLLRRDGGIEDVGYPYLGELWDAAPTAANAVYYAGIVREQSVFRQLAAVGAAISTESARPTGTADDAVESAEKAIFAIAQLGIRGEAVPLAECVNASLDRLDARERRETSGAVPTGFIDLDSLLCGLQNSELIILGARPSVGKTSLGMGLALNAAREGYPVFFASLEQARVELAERLLCCEASVDGLKIRRGYLSAEDRARLSEAASRLREYPIYIDDTPGQSALRVAANLRRLQLRRGIRLAVVDYLQLLEPEDRKANRQEQVAAAAFRLKHMAREAKIPVLALAQVNRGPEDRADGRPRLSDLRESGAIEAHADTVLLMHAPPESEGIVEIHVAKQRNGPTGVKTLTFLKHYCRFENYAVEMPFGRHHGNGYYAKAGEIE